MEIVDNLLLACFEFCCFIVNTHIDARCITKICYALGFMHKWLTSLLERNIIKARGNYLASSPDVSITFDWNLGFSHIICNQQLCLSVHLYIF